jgi:hypothetical protein
VSPKTPQRCLPRTALTRRAPTQDGRACWQQTEALVETLGGLIAHASTANERPWEA